MTVTLKDKPFAITIPRSVQRRAGFKKGDTLEFKASGGVITIVPKLPTANDEYTPAQRRRLDAALAAPLNEVKAGRTAGPFRSADGMIAHMQRELKKKAAAKTRKPVR